ncbi:hypothetical protein CN131_09370 [Sinorhizobium meliloti]|nr:hypothetical protein CN131_09370 [Sinorhizobium meliloti]
MLINDALSAATAASISQAPRREVRGRVSVRLQKLVGVRLRSYSNPVVDSYLPGMAKRGSTIIILLLVLVLLVIAIYGFLGIQQLI